MGAHGSTSRAPAGARAFAETGRLVYFFDVHPRDPHVEAALTRASDENGLPAEYRDCVRPLLRDPDGRWPECCGGTCEPCTLVLNRVAERTLQLLGTPRKPA